MGVRGRLLRDLLSSLKYIKNLSEKQIRASLWRGEGMLYNIEFDPHRLQELLVDVCPVGLEILSLHVDELYIKIPWSQLGTQSVLIVAKNVNVSFSLHCDDEADWRATIGPMLRRERQKKQRTLYAAPGSLADPAGTLNQLRQRTLHSLQMRADHVRLSVLSRHDRHLSAHRTSQPNGLEEALVVDFQDVLLTPCDGERTPSDQLKAMAVYEPRDRVLQLTRLLKCRAFNVLPPSGPPLCPHAATEFMDAPCVLTCNIVDRCTSDGPRICPVLLSTELLFDVPHPIKVRCSECQLCAFLAIVSDVAQLEEWRLNEELLTGRRPEELMDTSEVARTFAQGPSPGRQGSRQRASRPTSLIRATSAFGVSSSFWSSRKKTEDTPAACTLQSSAADAERGPVRALWPEEAVAGGPPGDSSGSMTQEPSGGGSPGEASGSGPPLQYSTEGQEEEDDDDDEDLFLDAEDLDYFSVASDGSPHGGASDSPKKGGDWLNVMRSWFRAQTPAPHCDEETTVDLSTHQARLALRFSSLNVHVAVPLPEGAACVEYSGEQVSLCIDARYELTQAQRECVRRFAWPTEDHPVQLWPWQLPLRVSSQQLLTFQRFTVDFSGAALLRALQPDQVDGEAMMVLSLRPRSAPPEVLLSSSAGKLQTWPNHLRLVNSLLFLHPHALSACVGLYKRVKPFLSGKVPPPELVAPSSTQQPPLPPPPPQPPPLQEPQHPPERRLFPAQCMMIEFSCCEFSEPGDAAISTEQRWPWRGLVPHLVMRSDSSIWDLAGLLGEGTCEPTRRVCSEQEALAQGMVSIPQEMFDELVRRAAETTRKDSEVSAAREELQRAYIALATSRPHAHAPARAAARPPEDSEGEQDELDRLRQKCLQLELSLQSQALAQRRLETELVHHQARAQEELRRLLVGGRGRAAQDPPA